MFGPIWGLSPLESGLVLAGLHLAIGTIAAYVAQQRGRNFRRWLGLGWIGGTPVLIAALLLKPQPQETPSDP